MTQAMTQDDFDLAKFIKLMKMTTATTDGEALNAIRMANAMLRRNGHDWDNLLRNKITIIADPFTSIPEPPKPAEPPQKPTWPSQPSFYKPPPSRPKPQRHSGVGAAKVVAYITILQRSSSSLDQSEQTTLNRITTEWNQYIGLFNIDHDWLEDTARELDLHPRDVFQVQQFFDVLDLAPLSQPELAKLRRVKGAWINQNDRLHNRDFSWLDILYNRHKPRTTPKGKSKRLF